RLVALSLETSLEVHQDLLPELLIARLLFPLPTLHSFPLLSEQSKSRRFIAVSRRVLRPSPGPSSSRVRTGRALWQQLEGVLHRSQLL
ncbi:hypothetical protein PFISCL1PPCAC_284, partial [Pristionchus fissidentatus]